MPPCLWARAASLSPLLSLVLVLVWLWFWVWILVFPGFSSALNDRARLGINNGPARQLWALKLGKVTLRVDPYNVAGLRPKSMQKAKAK